MATQLDAVCLALTAMWQAAPALDGVNVVDGPQANSEDLNEWLFIGYDADTQDENNDGANADQTWMAMNRVKREEGEVICAAVVRSGDVDIPAVRARAFAIVSAAEDELRPNHQLGGLVMQSMVAEQRFIPIVTLAGAKARVVFTVTYEAQI